MKKIRRFKTPLLWIFMLLLITGGIYKIQKSIPDTLYIDENEEIAYKLIHQEPWVTSSETIEVSTGDSYTVTCKLWNLFPLKTVTVSQVDAGEVAISGKHAGIYLETEGILVVGTESIITASGESIAPAENVLKKGDYIKAIDGQELKDKDTLVSYMKSSEGAAVNLDIVRDGQEEQVMIQPVYDQEDSYKLGIWVKDNTQGIGTITYITADGSYGALGHGVSDGDTGKLIGISSGELYTSEILSIQKGDFGTPGELRGVINYGSSEHLGTIEANTTCGIFGNIDKNRLEEVQTEWYQVAFKQEMQTGPATVVCSTGTGTAEYEIEIEDIYWSPNEINKCFSIHVTDDELLEETGGIVQGLSGSPIIQNDMLVGAVTHVLVNDPTRGFGIFIENMLEH